MADDSTRILRLTALACWLVFGACAGLAKAQEAEPDLSGELPRIAPLEPAEALETFIVQPGFRLEQAAAEPLVSDPVAIAFDENGRLYAVEMRGYSEQADESLSRVRLLEDVDGDGTFDKATVFAESLSWPTAIACYDGGVFVGDAPDIWYFKDTNGDGRADVRTRALTGFGKSNVQGLMNTFAWGLDNRIHLAVSSSGAQIRRAEDAAADPNGPALDANGRDAAFDPRTLAVVATSGGAQHGWSFDEWGRKFVCSNSDHAQQTMFEDRYAARNPYLETPGARLSIAADGPQAEVFRSSPVEPWRIVRTRLRVSGAVAGIVEGGGRPAGYFTGATGLTIYRGDAWPNEWRGVAIVGDVGSNLVHRKRLEPNGLEFIARRIDDKSEFVASTDIWFRPAQFHNGPDGALYVCDVYREVIEHPASLPPIIKKHLDLASGRDRGRIYRIVPEEFQRRPAPRLGSASTAELVALLAHSNGWHRDTAARLLYERQDAACVDPLRQLARESRSPLGRMHALHALAGQKALTVDVSMAALKDAHPRVREHAVLLSEPLANDAPALRAALYRLADDDDAGVRYQLAFTLGEIADSGRLSPLAKLAQRDVADRWARLAIQSSLAEGAGEMLANLAGDAEFRQAEGAAMLLGALAKQLGRQNRPADLAAVAAALNRPGVGDAAIARAVARGVSEGLASHGKSLPEALSGESGEKARELLARMLEGARQTAGDESQALPQRVEAVAVLGLGELAASLELLAGLIDNRQPQDLQLASLAALTRFAEPEVADVIVAAWPGMSPRLRQPATETLFSRPERVKTLLAAIASERISARDLDPARLKLLTTHADREIREQAEKLVASLNLGRRQDVVQQYRDVLDLKGDPVRGQAAFKKVCAACHKAQGLGHEIGPNLATVQNRGAEAILLNLLDPNREVNPQFVNYSAITLSGRSLTGMIANETASSITLKRAESATDVLLRVDIDQLQSTGLSIMPEGVEKDLSKQDLADLISYLLTLR